MLGRSAREKPSCDCGCEAALPNSRRYAKTSIGAAGSGRRRRPTAGLSADIRQNTRRRVAVARSRRKRAITQRNAAENAEQWFTAIVVASFFGSFEPCGPQPWPAEARKHPAVAGRAPQAAPESKSFVILNEVKNLFPCEPKAACGLCRARRRKTNEVQSRICLRILDTDSSSLCSSE